jgi:hypothetical protein
MSSDNPYDPFGFGGFTAEAMNEAGGDTAIVASKLRERIRQAPESDAQGMSTALEAITNDLGYLGIYDFNLANELLDEIVASPQLGSLEDPTARARIYLALSSVSDSIASQHISFDDLIRHRNRGTDLKDQIPGAEHGRTLHLFDLAQESADQISPESSERAKWLIAVAGQAANIALDRVPQILEEARDAARAATDDMSSLLSPTLHEIAKAMLKVDINRGIEIIDEAIASACEENYGSVTSEELIEIAKTIAEFDFKRALATFNKSVHALKGRGSDSESQRVCRKLRMTLEGYAARNPLYIQNLLIQAKNLEEELYGT